LSDDIEKDIKTHIAANIFSILKSHFNFVSIVITLPGNFTSNFVNVFSILTLLATREAQFHFQYK
jgi:hypothetical protein